MASTINTTNIDTDFPIAGQDNDSQGFRDNFTNINTNFEAAKTEIEALQDKQNLVAVPPTTIGAIGDLPGQLAYDGTYMYLCTAEYDGIANIWVRTAAATW